MPPRELALLTFSGKGGVGRTTLATATALRLCADVPERRILLCSTDPAHSLSDCLDREVGPTPVSLQPNLAAVELDAPRAFRRLKEEYTEELRLAFGSLSPNVNLPFDQPALERLLDLSPPGIDEVVAVAELAGMLQKPEFDLIVLDTAPTGHFVRLLEAPAVVEPWFRALLDVLLKHSSMFRSAKLLHRFSSIARDARHFRSLLLDPERAAVYGVSILTEMAFEETRDLVDSCTRMGVSVPVLFLNLATPPSNCPTCSAVRERELALLKRFAGSLPKAHLPIVYRGGEPRGMEWLRALGDCLYTRGDEPQK